LNSGEICAWEDGTGHTAGHPHRMMQRASGVDPVQLFLDLENRLSLEHASADRAIRRTPCRVLTDGIHLLVHSGPSHCRLLAFNYLPIYHGGLVSNEAHRAPVLDRRPPRSAAPTQRVFRAGRSCDNTPSQPHPVGGEASQTVSPGSPVEKYPPRKETPKSTHARRRPRKDAPSDKHELCDWKFTCPRRMPRGNTHASPSYPVRSPQTLRKPPSASLK